MKEVLREGYLDIKAPAGSPEVKFYKVWQRVWATASVCISQASTAKLILDISCGSEIPTQIKAPKEGLNIFRNNSRSRPLRSWALVSGINVLLYLAADNEEESQEWMLTIRNGLWPPLLPGEINKASSHEVSLVDSAESFSMGLLGAYGRLAFNGSILKLIHPHNGVSLIEWQTNSIQDVQLLRKVGENAGVFTLVFSWIDGNYKILQFYSPTIKETTEWIQMVLINTKESPLENKTIVSKPIINSKDHIYSNIAQEYAYITKFSHFDRLQNVKELTLEGDIPLYGVLKGKNKERQLIIDNLKELDSTSKNSMQSYGVIESECSGSQPITDKALECTPKNFKQGNNKAMHDFTKEINVNDWSFQDSDTFDLCEHVYDNLDRKESVDGLTLYEEIDSTIEMHPPPLPQALPNGVKVNSTESSHTLRLLMLSESINKALKVAEKPPERKACLKERLKMLKISKQAH
ncbi:uncharacterized protein LOC118205183 [Stegodyphus dumicola]|uniref:uncharacterized protein LOC118205183 n=1 Tax=Stegodyphus dumicola TaxID=202533 RepID=UPI0015B0DCF4|nr:uncharacterized protein LOC118205183 [Stegodyphus dumicola]